jgi:hypothetical protein
VVALAVGLLVLGWVLGGRPDLARVSIEGDRLMVGPKGMARILAFHRGLRLDRTAIWQVTSSTAVVSLRWACGFVPPDCLACRRACSARATRRRLSSRSWGRADKLVRINLSRGKIRYLVVRLGGDVGLLFPPRDCAPELVAGSELRVVNCRW